VENSAEWGVDGCFQAYSCHSVLGPGFKLLTISSATISEKHPSYQAKKVITL